LDCNTCPIGPYKPPVCPASGVQQFLNDHFQTGDFTDWTQTNFTIDNGTCLGFEGSIAPYLGSYDASAGANGPANTLEQILITPVPVSCITGASTFSVTYADMGVPCIIATETIRILYTDGTYTDVALPTPLEGSWETVDLRPYLQSGKTIRGVIFTTYNNDGYACDQHVGQISLKV
jgi:hypothetical protein